MKKKCIFIPLFLVLFISISFSQERQSPPVNFQKISDRLYQITGGRGANGGVYIGDNGVLVIDAKQDKQSVDQVIDGIKQITDKPVKYLVNTHSDGDHISGNRYFPETITFIAHENCREEFFHPSRSGQPSEWSNPELAPFRLLSATRYS